jgi:hypothetical protein
MDQLNNRQLYRTWNEDSKIAQNIASRHPLRRAIHYEDDVQCIKDILQRITCSIQSFMVNCLILSICRLTYVAQVETMLAIESTLEVSRAGAGMMRVMNSSW